MRRHGIGERKKKLSKDDEILYRVAATLGRGANETADTLDTLELSQWQQFFESEDARFSKMDAYLAQIAMLIDARLSSKPRKFRLGNYQIKYKKPMSDKELFAALAMYGTVTYGGEAK